ncbi:MAG: hypothetical protein FJ302_11655 [Planctomycetes bacterium]|nr:hypothetical protein [Planctomycetota bacterium]
MRDAVRVSFCSLFRGNSRGAMLSVVLILSGCTPQATTNQPDKPQSEQADQQAESRTLRNLQNAMESLRPEKLGIASGPEQAIAVLNEWAKSAKAEADKRGEGWEPHRPHGLLKSLSKEWIEQVSLEQFVGRDASYLRDCLWASKATRFAAGEAEKDLDVVVNLFDYVVRNIALIPARSRQVPMGPFDIMVFGRGTAADRAWAFAELLRQRNVDSVILSPRRPAGEAASDDHILVGVLFEKDILLFDPTLGLPLTVDTADPKSVLPRLPMSLRQAQRDPKLLAAITQDSGESFTLTSAMLEAPQVELICHSEQLSIRMKRLQQELTGENSLLVSDSLEDLEDQPGLWSRVAKHPAAAWSEDDVAIWQYPETMREAASQMTPEQQKELLKLSQSLAAPVRVQRFLAKQDGRNFDLEFAKPERMMMKRRMEHVIGRWSDVIPGYLAAQLYDVDPPTAKKLQMVAPDGKTNDDVSVVGATETRSLRLLLMQPEYAHIRKLHLQAGDDACFWLALCQFEQNRMQSVVDQCVIYANQHSSGGWVASNQSLMAMALAKLKKLKPAIRALKDIDEDDPASGGHRMLMARWQRLLEAAE